MLAFLDLLSFVWTGQGGGGAPGTPAPSQLWDIEVCTPVQTQATKSTNPIPHHTMSFPRLVNEEATPVTPAEATTPYFVGNRNTFQTPNARSPMTPRVSQRLVESLNLVLMDEEGEAQSSEASPRRQIPRDLRPQS